jgi:hypothetical protein
VATCATVPPAGLFFPSRLRCHAHMRPTDRNRSRKDAEARFPHRIDMRVPAYGEPGRSPRCWNDIVARMLAGDASAKDQFIGMAQTYLGLAREQFASTSPTCTWCGGTQTAEASEGGRHASGARHIQVSEIDCSNGRPVAPPAFLRR